MRNKKNKTRRKIKLAALAEVTLLTRKDMSVTKGGLKHDAEEQFNLQR